jgi:hypothetical protein
LQDDLAKFVSEPVLPPQLVEVPEEGKAKTKERREVGEGDTHLSLKTCPMRTTMRRRAGAFPAAVEVQPSWLASYPSRSGSAS